MVQWNIAHAIIARLLSAVPLLLIPHCIQKLLFTFAGCVALCLDSVA